MRCMNNLHRDDLSFKVVSECEEAMFATLMYGNRSDVSIGQKIDSLPVNWGVLRDYCWLNQSAVN